MISSLEHRPDGSYRLFINSDLQFDSADERIYHEALGLPALAVACKRFDSPLRVLVIGGGDGLIARELFKSDKIDSVDLVDYDPQIIEYARQNLSVLNDNSLANPKLKVHVEDAWNFVEKAVSEIASYHLIVCDLTVADDTQGARFHTVEWYKKLHALLPNSGVLSVNGCSPQATPRAYCSILNGLLLAGFLCRPMHATIPSFAEMGYGDDWGFFLSSPTTIMACEFDEVFERLQPRQWLHDLNKVRQLFVFPAQVFKHQESAAPALVGSDVLLSYFYNDAALESVSDVLVDSLTLNFDSATLPKPDTGKTLLPNYINQALAKSLSLNSGSDSTVTADPRKILDSLVELMPAVYADQCPEIVADFLADPASFLRGLDLSALVSKLLDRANELPSRLVAELIKLRQQLETWTMDNLTISSVGEGVLTILTLAIVLGNLLYPDMVYAKGPSATGHAAGHAHAADRGVGRRGGYGGGGYYGNRNVYTNRVTKPTLPAPTYSNPKGVQIKNYKPSPTKGSLPQPANFIGMELQTIDAKRDLLRRHDRATAKHSELTTYADILQQELNNLEESTQTEVLFGTRNVPREEAIRKTKLSLGRTTYEVGVLKAQIAQIQRDLSDTSSKPEGPETNDDNSTS
jgi:spermidine synthase